MKNRLGFTLIELLVVMAVIVVLMGLLIPVLKNVRLQAHSTVCQSNLRQWGCVWNSYLNDHENNYPSTAAFSYPWFTIIWNYYKNAEFRLCPSASKPARPDDEGSYAHARGNTFYAWGRIKADPDMGRHDTTYGSYGLNYAIRPAIETEDILFRQYHFTAINIKPANEIPLMTDSAYFRVDVRNGGTVPRESHGILPDIVSTTSYPSTYDVFINRHNGGINMLFADFSVKNARLKKLFGYKWNPIYVKNQDIPDQWPQWMAGLPGRN